jgi:hypothetical protein
VLDPNGLVQLQMNPSLMGEPVAGAAVVPAPAAVVDDALELDFLDDDPQADATSVTAATSRTATVQLRARVPLCLIASPVLTANPTRRKSQS